MIKELNEVLSLLESVKARELEESSKQGGLIMPTTSYLELTAARMKLREVIWAVEATKLQN